MKFESIKKDDFKKLSNEELNLVVGGYKWGWYVDSTNSEYKWQIARYPDGTSYSQATAERYNIFGKKTGETMSITDEGTCMYS
ncbi:MAG: bacteriocin [Bacteroidales bacterium]|jgi:bacteriocin-like protein|nr:bacteriocin [Bacteroidales bacterium]